MNIIIPLCGFGSRFSDEGYLNPKPLIKIMGKEMIFWVIDNLNLSTNDTVTIIYHNSLDSFNFTDRVKRRYSNINFIRVDERTRGAAETLLYGLNNIKIDMKDPIMVMDGDTFYNDDIISRYKKIKNNSIFYFEDFDDKPIYSYIDMDVNKIKDIKEKEKISNNANSGCYCFESADLAKKYCDKVVSNNVMSKQEFYISNVYSEMIKDNIDVFGEKVDSFVCLGTPLLIKIFCESSDKYDKLRFCFDFDNTLVTYPQIKDDYTSVLPIKRNIEILKFLKKMGHTIIVYTARRMRTHSGNVGKVVSDVGRITMDSLDDFNIPYDELYFGKPYAHFYIDDLAISAFGDIEKETGFYKTKIQPRYFNDIEMDDNSVTKESKSDEIKGEIYWYKNIPKKLSYLFPKVTEIGDNYIKMEKIQSVSFSYLYINKSLTFDRLDYLFDQIKKLHNQKTEDNKVNIYSNYSNKLTKRYLSYDYNQHGDYKLLYENLITKLKEYENNKMGKLGVIHGDTVFTNILIDVKSNIKLIDMRGMLGDDLTINGDIMYDYAKIYQSILGYDFILNDKELDYDYISTFRDYFEKKFISIYNEELMTYVKYITSSLLFSLVPLHSNEKCIRYLRLSKSIIK